jgi:hypothetical protein
MKGHPLGQPWPLAGFAARAQWGLLWGSQKGGRPTPPAPSASATEWGWINGRGRRWRASDIVVLPGHWQPPVWHTPRFVGCTDVSHTAPPLGTKIDWHETTWKPDGQTTVCDGDVLVSTERVSSRCR